MWKWYGNGVCDVRVCIALYARIVIAGEAEDAPVSDEHHLTWKTPIFEQMFFQQMLDTLQQAH